MTTQAVYNIVYIGKNKATLSIIQDYEIYDLILTEHPTSHCVDVNVTCDGERLGFSFYNYDISLEEIIENWKASIGK